MFDCTRVRKEGYIRSPANDEVTVCRGLTYHIMMHTRAEHGDSTCIAVTTSFPQKTEVKTELFVRSYSCSAS